MNKFFYILFFLSISSNFLSQVNFGNGVLPSLTISSPQIVNSYKKVTGVVGNNFSLTNTSAFPVVVGDVVLAINMVSGHYELRNVINVIGNVIDLGTGSVVNTNFSSNSQLVLVPQYSSLIIATGGKIYCPQWNVNEGGVVCLLVSATLDLSAGEIDVEGMGYYSGVTGSGMLNWTAGGQGGIGGSGGLGGFSGTNASINASLSGFGGSPHCGAGWGADQGSPGSNGNSASTPNFGVSCGSLIPACNNSPNPSGRLYFGNGGLGGVGGNGTAGAGGAGGKCNQPGGNGGAGGNGGNGGNGGRGGGIIIIKANTIQHTGTLIKAAGQAGTSGTSGSAGGAGGIGTCGGGGGNGADGGDGGGGGNGGAGGSVKVFKLNGGMSSSLVNVAGGAGLLSGVGGNGGAAGVNSTNCSGVCSCPTLDCALDTIIYYLSQPSTYDTTINGVDHFIWVNGIDSLDMVYTVGSTCTNLSGVTFYTASLYCTYYISGVSSQNFSVLIASSLNNILSSLINYVNNNPVNLDTSGNTILTSNYWLQNGCNICSQCQGFITPIPGNPGNSGPNGTQGGNGYYNEECLAVQPTFNPIGPFCQLSPATPLPLVSNNGISGTWSPATIDTSTPGVSVYTFTPSSTAALTCVMTATMNVVVATLPLANISGTATVCANSFPPTVTFYGSSAAPPYTFNYTLNGVPATISTSATSSSVTLYTPSSLQGTNVYSLMDVSVGSCSNVASGTATITVIPTPVISSQPISVQTICQGAYANPLSIMYNGGLGPPSYQWYSNFSNSSSGGVPIPGATSPNFSPSTSTLGTTYYYCIITFPNGCGPIASSLGMVTVVSIPVLGPMGNQVLCNGTISTAINFTSNVPSTFSWTASGPSGSSSGVGTFPPQIFTNNSCSPIDITVMVVATTLYGCSSVPSTSNIHVNPTPSVSSVPDQIYCNGTNASITLPYSCGNVINNNISWSCNSNPPIGTFTLTNNGYLFITAINNYTFPITSMFSVTTTYTDMGLSCPGNPANFSITVNPSPIVSAGQDQTICSGGSLTLNGSGANSYIWNNGVSDGSAFTPQTSGTYTVTGIDLNGCQNTDVVAVNIAPVINATLNLTGCDSVLWNNQTFYTSTTLQFQGQTALGCDSNTVVNIILSNNTSTVDSIIICGSFTWSLNGQTYNQSGIYIANSTGINGCDSMVTLVLTINNPPNPPIVSSAVNINQGIYFTTPFQNDVTYQWLTCPNFQVIPGEITNTYDPILNGNYAVIVSNACGSDTSECIDINSVFDFSINMDIVLFPNPTFSVISVIGLKDAASEFEICDGQGRVLKKGDISSSNAIIDLSSFAKGIYLIKIKEFGVYEIIKE